ncbi:MauE/DoxX family redox-associated membrane protein [Luteococcus sp. Sow4_B9]|uniref:MauE/DoxX family redox-associated membrane protein n=1 Tax=Luteococcus sp. Sow4_B9 TaxID=3438792 RepID=UPI003F9449B8
MIENGTTDATVGNGWKDWVGLVCRLILGGALLYAGLTKVGNLEGNVLSVRAYRIEWLPYSVERVIGYSLPFFEIILGLLLIVGLFTRISGLIGALTMAVFIAAIASAWARGLSIDCGCFSQGGETENPKYLQEIIRDLGFLACGAWLTWRPRTPFSLDGRLFGPLAPLTFDHTENFDETDFDTDEADLVREDKTR